MVIDVVFYGGLKAVCGTRAAQIDLDSAPPPTVAAALARLTERFEGLAGRLERVAVAVGDELVDRDHVLREGDELCLLPPVSGGAARFSHE